MGVLTALLGGGYLLWLMHRQRDCERGTHWRRTGLQVKLGRRDWSSTCRRWTLPAGRWTAIVGPNGAGKSTLLKALARPAAGAGQGAAAGPRDRRLAGTARARTLAWLGQGEPVPTT